MKQIPTNTKQNNHLGLKFHHHHHHHWSEQLYNILNSYPFIIQSCEYWPLSMWVWSLHLQTIITRQMSQRCVLWVSRPAINCWQRFGLSSSSTLSLCTWHPTTLFSRSWDMVALSQALPIKVWPEPPLVRTVPTPLQAVPWVPLLLPHCSWTHIYS